MMMVKHTLKHHQVEVVPSESDPGCFEVARRIETLRGKGLEAIDLEMWQLLDRAVHSLHPPLPRPHLPLRLQ